MNVLNGFLIDMFKPFIQMRLIIIILTAFLSNSCMVYYYTNDKLQIKIKEDKYFLSDESIENISIILSEGKVLKKKDVLICKDKEFGYQLVFKIMCNANSLMVVSCEGFTNETDSIFKKGDIFVVKEILRTKDDYDSW